MDRRRPRFLEPPAGASHSSTISLGRAAMSQAKHVHQLLEQLGPSTPEVTNVTQIAEDVWAVGYDEQSVLILQMDDDASTLVVSCAVGRPRPESRETVFEALLTYNSQWRQTGGVRMAMADGET